MSNPVCYANPTVNSTALNAAQEIASQSFSETRPVQSYEMLDPRTTVDRYLLLRSTPEIRRLNIPVPSPRRDLMDGVARIVVDAMHVAMSVDQRTYTNVSRLLGSDRVSDSQVVSLLTALASNPNDFHVQAHRMFMEAGLFYYVSLANNGVTCFMNR